MMNVREFQLGYTFTSHNESDGAQCLSRAILCAWLLGMHPVRTPPERRHQSLRSGPCGSRAGHKTRPCVHDLLARARCAHPNARRLLPARSRRLASAAFEFQAAGATRSWAVSARRSRVPVLTMRAAVRVTALFTTRGLSEGGGLRGIRVAPAATTTTRTMWDGCGAL